MTDIGCSCWNVARDGHQVDCRLPLPDERHEDYTPDEGTEEAA